MTGWNMPPGVNVSDIPGNRPEDVEFEEIMYEFYATLTEKEWEKAEPLDNIFGKAIEFGIKKGWEQCRKESTELA